MIKVAWDFISKPEKRREMLREYFRHPFPHLFITVWMVFFVMFFVGIFVPIFGEMNVTEDGWQVWEVGILGFFGMWVITWFVDLDKLEKRSTSDLNGREDP